MEKSQIWKEFWKKSLYIFFSLSGLVNSLITLHCSREQWRQGKMKKKKKDKGGELTYWWRWRCWWLIVVVLSVMKQSDCGSTPVLLLLCPEKQISFFFPSLLLFLLAFPPISVFVSSPSSFYLLFLFSLLFLSFWSPLSFYRPLFPSLYFVLFLSSILRLFFSSPWFSLSDPLKMFPLLSPCFFFFFKIFLSQQNSLLCSPFCSSLYLLPKCSPPPFVLVSLLSNLYFFSFSRPQILYSFVPSFLSCPLIFLSVCLLYLKSLYILH